jgi:RNA polymerase sigma-70 factor (ECF subfamily)
MRLTAFEGVPQVDAARRLGISTSGMKSRVQRGRRLLREALLACCEVSLDRRGGIAAFRSPRGVCGDPLP